MDSRICVQLGSCDSCSNDLSNKGEFKFSEEDMKKTIVCGNCGVGKISIINVLGTIQVDKRVDLPKLNVIE